MRRFFALPLFASILLAATATYAVEHATPEEAKALAIKAAEYLRSVGPEKAFAEFSAKDGPWRDRDLYVSVEDDKSVLKAHGAMPALIGRSMVDLKDVDGVSISGQIQGVKDVGWIHYKWMDPATKAVEPKTAYEVRVGEYVVGVGAYVK
jgi:cytochrome c